MRARAQKGKSLSFYSVVPFMDLFHISFFLYLFFLPTIFLIIYCEKTHEHSPDSGLNSKNFQKSYINVTKDVELINFFLYNLNLAKAFILLPELIRDNMP